MEKFSEERKEEIATSALESIAKNCSLVTKEEVDGTMELFGLTENKMTTVQTILSLKEQILEIEKQEVSVTNINLLRLLRRQLKREQLNLKK